MSKHYERHVQSLVADFLEMLEPEVRSAISREHLDQLEMLVESAISTAVLEQTEAVANQINALAAAVRRGAETYDSAAA